MSTITNIPLILVYGSGDSHTSWYRQIAALGESHVFAIELPGHGDRVEEAANMPNTVSGFVASVWKELDNRGIKRFRIAGHSLGSAIALQMALDEPQRVIALGLFGSGARLRVAPEIMALAESDPPRAFQELLRYGYPPETSIDIVRLTIASFLPTAPSTLLNDLTACNSFDIMSELTRITAPALVVVGSEDRLTPPKYAEYLASHLPNAQLITIAGAGHFLMHEQPERLTAILQQLQQLG